MKVNRNHRLQNQATKTEIMELSDMEYKVSTSQINKKIPTSQHIVSLSHKLQNTKDREDSKSSQIMKTESKKGAAVQLTADLSAAAMGARLQWNNMERCRTQGKMS